MRPARPARVQMASGQAVPVPKTPSAANMTARLPSASLREQIHTDRMFASPVRKRYNIDATPPGSHWTATALHVFDISTTGEEPVGELVRDPAGRLFGVAYNGGSAGAGAVFQVTP